MKGTPFEEQKPQQIKAPKPTIQEIADEEPHPITNPDANPIGPQDYLSENKPVPNHPVEETPKLSKPQPEPETELKSVDLEELPDLEEGEFLITYLKEEPIIGILEQGQSPLTKKFEEPTFSYSRQTGKISQLAKFPNTQKYSFTSNVHIHAKTSVSQTLAHGSEKDNEAKGKTFEELVPEQYRDYKKVFEKAASERFPKSQPWDHAIKLKPDFIPCDCKVYPLTPAEQKKMDDFLEENLKKGYNLTIKTPYNLPIFLHS